MSVPHVQPQRLLRVVFRLVDLLEVKLHGCGEIERKGIAYRIKLLSAIGQHGYLIPVPIAHSKIRQADVRRHVDRVHMHGLESSRSRVHPLLFSSQDLAEHHPTAA